MGKRTGKPAKISLAPRCGYDGNAPEFAEARDVEVYVTNRETGVPAREKSTSPQNINIDRVEWMYAHGQIEFRQAEAARRLQRDWEKAEICPVASSVLVGAGGGEPQLPNDAKVAAMRRHGDAAHALGRDWPLVDLVVHRLYTVVQAAKIMRLHHQKAAGKLDSALHHLADHYGFPRERDVVGEKNSAQHLDSVYSRGHAIR